MDGIREKCTLERLIAVCYRLKKSIVPCSTSITPFPASGVCRLSAMSPGCWVTYIWYPKWTYVNNHCITKGITFIKYIATWHVAFLSILASFFISCFYIPFHTNSSYIQRILKHYFRIHSLMCCSESAVRSLFCAWASFKLFLSNTSDTVILQ